MHLPTLPLLLTLLPSALAAHSPPGPFPFPFRFNTTGTTTNLTLPTGPPPRLPAWHPWTPGRNRGPSDGPRGRGRRRPGRIFPSTLNTTLPSNTTLTTPPTMIPPTSLQSYRITTGSISCSSPTGLISKSPTSPESDTSVLVSFQLPGAARDKTCQLFFYLATNSNQTEVSEGGRPPPRV